MGYGNRPSGGNLFAEIRNNGAVAAKDVPKARGDESRAVGVFGVQFAEERLDINLRNTFACSHDIGGVDGFVGRDHDKPLHAVFDRHVRHVLRAGDVGLYRFVRETLHERHMLIRRGVIDDIRAHFAEDLFDASSVANVCNHGDESCLRVLLLQVQNQVVQGRLRHLQEDSYLWCVWLYLPHQFASYTACRTADQNHFVLDDLPDVLRVDVYLRAFQEILNADCFHASDALGVDLVQIIPLREVRSRENADVMIDEYLQVLCGVYLPHFQRGDDHMVYSVTVHPFE